MFAPKLETLAVTLDELKLFGPDQEYVAEYPEGKAGLKLTVIFAASVLLIHWLAMVQGEFKTWIKITFEAHVAEIGLLSTIVTSSILR